MDIDLRKLRQLLAIQKAGSFSRAAEQLNITQPALSRSVAAMEQGFGFRLFERGRAGVAATTVGAQFLADAAALVRDAGVLEHNAGLYSRGEAGKVSFGMGPLIASLVLARLGADMLARHPRLQLRCSIKTGTALLGKLLDGEIETMFCAANQIGAAEDLEIRPIGTLDFAIFARGGHPLAERPVLQLADLEPYPFACSTETHWRQLSGRWGAMICDNYEILREVVLRGDAVWLSSPQMLADDLKSSRIIQLPVEDFSMRGSDVAMVQLSNRTSSAASKAITEYIAGLFTPS